MFLNFEGFKKQCSFFKFRYFKEIGEDNYLPISEVSKISGQITFRFSGYILISKDGITKCYVLQ